MGEFLVFLDSLPLQTFSVLSRGPRGWQVCGFGPSGTGVFMSTQPPHLSSFPARCPPWSPRIWLLSPWVCFCLKGVFYVYQMLGSALSDDSVHCFLSLPDQRPFVWPGPSETKRLLGSIFLSFPWIRRFFMDSRFFLNFIPPWIFRWFPVLTIGIASAQKPGVCVSLPTKVYYEFFFKLSMQWSYVPVSFDSYRIPRPTLSWSHKPGPSPVLWTPLRCPIFPLHSENSSV